MNATNVSKQSADEIRTKRRIVFEFEVDEKLENLDPHYKGASGAIQIAHEMIKCVVTENQAEVILRASDIKAQKCPGWEEFAEFTMRFHQAQRSLKIVGFLDENNSLFMLDEASHTYIRQNNIVNET